MDFLRVKFRNFVLLLVQDRLEVLDLLLGFDELGQDMSHLLRRSKHELKLLKLLLQFQLFFLLLLLLLLLLLHLVLILLLLLFLLELLLRLKLLLHFLDQRVRSGELILDLLLLLIH